MNNFDSWNELKEKVDKETDEAEPISKKRRSVDGALGKNIGFEQNGSGDNFSRPVLIIKKFNNHMFWSIPLSTKQKKFDFYYNFTDTNNNRVSVILATKTGEYKRLKRKLYELSDEKLKEIKDKLKTFL